MLNAILFVSVVKIDLKTCKSGKLYQRTKERLSIIKATLLIKWQPEDNKICPSSIAKYFYDSGFIVKECSNEFTSRIEYSVKVPEIDFNDPSESEELVEWLGMLTLGCDLDSEKTDDFINSYQSPQSNTTVGQVKILQWRGYFSAQEVKRLLDYLR